MTVGALKGMLKPHNEPDGDEKGMMAETKGKKGLRRRLFGKTKPNDHDADN